MDWKYSTEGAIDWECASSDLDGGIDWEGDIDCDGKFDCCVDSQMPNRITECDPIVSNTFPMNTIDTFIIFSFPSSFLSPLDVEGSSPSKKMLLFFTSLLPLVLKSKHDANKVTLKMTDDPSR